MKKLILLLIISTAILLLWIKISPLSTSSSAPTSPISFSTSEDPLTKMTPISYQGKDYLFSSVKIQDISSLKLYSNSKNMDNSRDLIDKHHCSILVNGGFYDTKDKPIGWLVSNHKEISHPVISSLLNGYLFVDQKTFTISPHRPKNTSQIGLQSGPLLILDSKPLLLKIKDDQPRRRNLAIKDSFSNLIFMTVVGSDSQFSGPLLADLPNLLIEIQKITSQTFNSAINLDGGSASAFFISNTLTNSTESFYLKEFSPVGSFFCYSK